MESFTLNSTIKTYPTHPYETIKNAVLGKKYALTLTFIGTKRAQQLNHTYRYKDYVPNVLSFPLDEMVGEIYICPEIAFPEAPDFSLSPESYVAFLFIHGMLHLKGYHHGATMEEQERRFVAQFGLT